MLQTDVIQAMGMPFTIRYRVQQPLDLSAVTARVNAWLQAVDRDFSPFKPDSLVRRLQRGDLELADWTPTMQEVYGLATRAHSITDGAFDPWYAGAYDPTGLVKGWAIQRAFERYLAPLLATGRVSAVALNGAGDMQVGVATDTSFRWGVGIADPANPDRVLARYALGNAAVATSGFSKRGQHIRLQDRTHSLLQATVVAPHLIAADVWATAALAMGQTRYVKLAAAQHQAGLLLTARHDLVTIGGERVA